MSATTPKQQDSQGEEEESSDDELLLADIEALKRETIKSIIEDRSIMYKR